MLDFFPAIHLLKTFINASNFDGKTMMWRTIIHLAFVVSALGIAWTERLATLSHPVPAH